MSSGTGSKKGSRRPKDKDKGPPPGGEAKGNSPEKAASKKSLKVKKPKDGPSKKKKEAEGQRKHDEKQPNKDESAKKKKGTPSGGAKKDRREPNSALPTEFEEVKAARRPAVEKRHSSRRRRRLLCPDEPEATPEPLTPVTTPTTPPSDGTPITTTPNLSSGSLDSCGNTPESAKGSTDVVVKAAEVENLKPELIPKEFELVSHFVYDQDPAKVKKPILSAECLDAALPPPDTPAPVIPGASDHPAEPPEDGDSTLKKNKIKATDKKE